MGTVRGDHPKPLDLAVTNAVHNLVVGSAWFRRNPFLRHTERGADFCSVSGVCEIMSANKAGDVGIKPRAHRIALTRDRICASARAADIAGHQREVDDGLRRARGLMALVDAHGPPE